MGQSDRGHILMSANTGPPPRRVYSTGSMDPENENYGYEDEYGKTSGSNGMNGYPDNMDHSAHELFVEMDELVDDVWVEKSRWIKYEEQLDMERGVWNKPQVANISYQSITSLRDCIENSEMMLDLDARDFPQVVKRIVDRSKLGAKEKAEIQKVLMFRHKHVNKQGLMTRSQSLIEQQNSKLVFMAGKKEDIQFDVPLSQARGDQRKESTINCLETENEATSVLVGSINVITKPMTVIVRLNQAIKMPKTTEVSLPVRFIYIGFTPVDYIEMDPYEMGRAIGTLMANKAFHTAAYKTKDKKEIFDAMDIFLNQTIILPPGDWDRRSLLPMAGMIDMRKKLTERGFTDNGGKGTKLDKKIKPDENDAPDKKMEVAKRNPLQRTKMPFGGLIDDIRYRYPLYLSDIKDGLNAQCVAATIFIYFACLSGAIAFGGLMGTSTGNLIGISETIIVSSVSGLIFSLFAGCPLTITGVTGPVLLYDQALYSFCQSSLPDKFLPWRFWIGMWTFVISLVVAGFQGSTLVRYFTRFTKDIFNALVALLFIVSAFEKLGKIFGAHPLAEIFWYCETLPTDCLTDIVTLGNSTASEFCQLDTKPEKQPNTALLSMFLMLGTFFIAYFLRIMRTSHYFGRNARKAMGDFGVPIAIALMVFVAWLAGDSYSEKLQVPSGITVTNSIARGWMIPPTGRVAEGDPPLPIWAMVAAFLPALLLYLLFFMETHICELIMM